jgi:dTDP-4-dehydrorhamnose reductase
VDAGFKYWGVCHVVSRGWTSWHGFAKAIFAEAARRGIPLKVKEVQEITTSDYPTPARRPMNSRLDSSKLKMEFGIELPEWQDALRECLTRVAQKANG